MDLGRETVICSRCGMSFPNIYLLRKHKQKFCHSNSGIISEYQRDRRGRVGEMFKQKDSELDNMYRSWPEYGRTNGRKPIDNNYGSRDEAPHAHLSHIPKMSPQNGRYQRDPNPDNNIFQTKIDQLAKVHGRKLREIRVQAELLEKQQHELEKQMMSSSSSGSSRSSSRSSGRYRPSLDSKTADENSQVKKMIEDLKREEMQNRAIIEEMKLQLNEVKASTGRNAYQKRVGVPMRLQDPQPIQQASFKDSLTQQPDLLEKSKIEKQILLMEEDSHRLSMELGELQRQHQLYRDMQHEEQIYMMQNFQQEMELLKLETKMLKHKMDQVSYPELSPNSKMSRDRNQLITPLVKDTAPIFQNERNHDLDLFQRSPYDPGSGLMVFYDYVTGLDPSFKYCQIFASLCEPSGQLSKPTKLPLVECQAMLGGGGDRPYYGTHSLAALLGVKQAVPRLPVTHGQAILIEVELKTSTHLYSNPANPAATSFPSRCWTKMELFDEKYRLISGYWKIALRVPPVVQHLSFNELNTIPQFGKAEIHMRLVNWRDTKAESLVHLQNNSNNLSPYMYPEISSVKVPRDTTLPDMMCQQRQQSFTLPRTAKTPPTPEQSVCSEPIVPTTSVMHTRQVERIATPKYSVSPRVSPRVTPYSIRKPFVDHASNLPSLLGIQIDNLWKAPDGIAKVEVAVYHSDNGELAKGGNTSLIYAFRPASNGFVQNRHIFAEFQAFFKEVDYTKDMVLLLRIFLQAQKRNKDIPDDHYDDQPLFEETQELVAWAILPLLDSNKSKDYQNIEVRTGFHHLPLYLMPDPVNGGKIETSSNDRVRYGQAAINFHVSTSPGPIHYTSEETVDDDRGKDIQNIWTEHKRDSPPVQQFNRKDGFHLFIDGAHSLPDSATISRVTGRIFDSNYNKYGDDIGTTVELDSDGFNPTYNFRMAVTSTKLPADAIILFKVYTIDKFTKKLEVIGFATLNVFVIPGSEVAPSSTYENKKPVALNVGSFQLRLYQKQPDYHNPLTMETLPKFHKPFPCSSLLVQLQFNSGSSQSRTSSARKIPKYSNGIYYTMHYKPSQGEKMVLVEHKSRPAIPVRHCATIAADGQKTFQNDKDMETWIIKTLTRDKKVLPADWNNLYLSKYQVSAGFTLAVDQAVNLPWHGFTHAIVMLNPPSSLYKNDGHTYDRPLFTQELDFNSPQKCPRWKDGLLEFSDRLYYQKMTVIIHLMEITASSDRGKIRCKLGEEAWTAMQIFEGDYVNMGLYQLPLYDGAPPQQALDYLMTSPCQEGLKKSLSKDKLKLVQNASVYVRIADSRRCEEISKLESTLNASKEYLPDNWENAYVKETNSTSLRNLIPDGKSLHEFQHDLASQFQQLVGAYLLAKMSDS